MDPQVLYPMQLLDVRLFEAEVKRITPKDDGQVEDVPVEDENSPAPLQLSSSIVRHEENPNFSMFLTLMTTGPTQENPTFTLSVTLEGMFEIMVDLDELDEDIWNEFEQVSSVTLLWPYAREYLHSFSRRMRVDLPVLPTLNRLALQAVEEPEAELEC